MPWTPQGGGGGGNNNGPWGRGGGGSGGGGQNGPDFEDMIRRSQEKLRRAMPGGGFSSGRGLGLVLVLGLLAWGASGIYMVQPEEQGVVLRFGKWDGKTTTQGMHYHLPYPIETVLLPKTTVIQQISIGREQSFTKSGQDGTQEGRMLTGQDENIVEAAFTVRWKIGDAGKYLFNAKDHESMVKVTAEAAMREVIGRKSIQGVLSEDRAAIADEATRELRRLLNEVYDAGIEIVEVQLQKTTPPAEVIAAFDDVQSARANRDSEVYAGKTYRDNILPRAEGDAVRKEEEAKAYREQVVSQAQGVTQRFLALQTAYSQAQEATEVRLYLETMDEILPKSAKIIIDPSSKGGQGVIPYLPLPEITKPTPASTLRGTP